MNNMEVSIQQAMQEIGELLYQFLWSHLQSLGLFREKHVVLNDLRELAGISAGYDRWLQESIALLEHQQYLHCHDAPLADGRTICTVVDTTLIENAALWQRWDQLKEGWMYYADLEAQVILVETTLRTLPAILTGQRPATEVLFPNGSMQLVEGIYQHNATADYFNDVLATLLVIYLRERLTAEKHARIRILEIGAGTGGTTSRVLQMLQPYQASVAEYCYSDISKSFLQYGQKVYGAEHSYLTYRLLNVEKPLSGQGIEAGSYDVVIATNVLHATSNIQRTVRNTKAALKKHGLLLLNEITGANLFAHLTFGLLEGWWAYKDPELRVPGCPALTAENWEAVLSSEGFRAISFPTRDMQEAGQQVIVAESDGVVRQARKQSDTNARTSQTVVPTQSGSRRSVAASNRKGSDVPRSPHFVTDQMVKDYVRSIILESIAEVLKVHEGTIQEERNFPEYGVDSIVALKLINVINQKGNLTLRVTVLFEHNSVEQLLQYILRDHTATLMATLQESVQARGPGVEGIQTSRSESTRSARYTDYSNQNVEYLAQNIRHNRQWRRFQTPMPQHEPIAIIGMSGRFARSKTVNELWEHLANGTDLIEEVSRWDHAELDPVSAERRVPYCKHGSFLEGIDLFDPLFFNISGFEATYMDPQQRLVLEEGWKALEDAGYVGESIEGRRCGVYIGCVAGDYQLLFDGLPPAQAFWGNVDSVVPARIAYYLNLVGPAIAIDTACSSSLVAMHLACQGLWSGEMDMALAGGVYVQCTPQFYQRASSAGMLSATGHCSTFDNRADGFVPGEGVGMVVIKRLKDALASGDHIYGVIRGSGINQDGATTGITVPSGNAQEQLERSVYETFQIDPAQIQMVEAHGTGTKLGDPIEYEALTQAFRKYTDLYEYCAIGSIKTNIGHTITTAGVAGVIKILLALQHRQIPPSLHFQSGNEHIQFKESPFYVNTRLKDWEIEGGETRRCAAVSSFGFSGTNAHMVIEEAPEHVRRHAQRPGYLIVLSARTPDQLRQQVEQLAAFCENSPELDCGNISYTLLLGRKHMKHRLACVVRSHQELGALLRKWLAKGKVPEVSVSNLENREQGENVSLRDYGNQCIENCQHWTASAPDIYLEQLSTVADLYLQGYRLAFEQLFAGEEHSRISLPTYPFAREHYWIPISKGTQATTGLSALHPLVQRNTSTLWEQRFSSTFRGDEFFLADHVIMGRRIMPGVAYLEMARAAVAAAWGQGKAIGEDAPSSPNCLRLSHVVWARPLVISAHPVTVHISLEAQESGRVTFLISEDGQGQEDGGLRTADHLWRIGQGQAAVPTAPVRSVPLLLSRGTAEWYEESASGLAASQSLDLPAVQARCQHQIPVTEWYEQSRSLGISYGPALQGIEQMSVGEDEVLARLRLPVAPGGAHTYAGGSGIGAWHGIGIGSGHDHRREPNHRGKPDGYGPRLLPYVLHPSMLDAALQSCFALSMLGSSEHQDPHLPFELEEISIMGEVPAQGWAWGRQRPRSTAGSVFDIEVCDDEGRIVVRLRGLSSRTLQEAPALPTEQEARVCDSEAPDIRRDSSYESQQYKAQRLQHLSAPSLQAPFPRNDGEITDQMVRDHVQLILLESIAEVLQIDERNIEEDISFSEYGVDSIVAVNLINVINQKSHLSLQVTVLFDNNNIEQLVQHILREEMTTLKALLQDGRQGHSSVRRPGQALPLQDETAPGVQERLIDVGQGTSQRGLVGARMGASPAPTAPALSVPTATVRETGADADRAERNVPITSLRTGVVGTRTGASPVPTNGATQTTKGIDDLATHHEPIAIIGMSGRFAHSKTVSELWEHLANGTDLVEEVSQWDLTELSPTSGEKTEPYCKHGSFLEEIDLFDPLFFNISRHEAAYMDPQQRLVLEEAWKVLEDAGYAGSSIEGRRCGVYIGCISGDYPHLFNDVPPAQAFWGNASSVIPARIAYYLNLQGPAIAIDAACSSSLVAIHLACQSLWNGETEMALAGGIFLQCTPQFYQSANRAGMLSVTGHCYTFDDRADGFVPGEGVGIVVLKRLKDAEASGDHIYGVIRGSGINQDGTTRGITVPSANSQERLLRSVYETFQIDPAQIQMVEAHGTGTQLGDPIEYEALTRAFRQYTDKKEYCALGSIKTNLGHTATAAGVAGIIKILLSLQHKQIPPSLHFQSGNAHIQFKGSPFYVNTGLQDWRQEERDPGSPQGTRQGPDLSVPTRCAAISSFGFSGTNAHMVIEEAPECSCRHAEMPGYLIVLSARTPDQLRQQVEQLMMFCEGGTELDCGNMSYTLLLGRKHLKHRLACVVRGHQELEALLRKWLEKGKVPQISVSNLENWELRETPALRRYGNQCIEDCYHAPTPKTYLEQLSTIADLFLQGYTLAFEQLFAGEGYTRISLPTYPFARERCWANEMDASRSNQWDRGNRLSASTGYNTSHGLTSVDESTASAGRQVRLDTLREALAHIVSRMLKVRLEEIDAETEFSEYGTDSITFVKFADHLNQTYQLDLTPALFYEHSTLERLTQFLHATYASLLAPHFATASPEMLPQKDGSQDKVPPTAPVTRQRSHIARPLVPDPLVGAEPIAIIGMSGAFPQARDVESLWSNLLEGRDCIGEIPASRWDWQTFFGSPDACAKVISAKWAGVIEDVETFDPQFFGISPSEAEQMDPQQRLLMIYVWKAIEDAGYAASSLSGTNTALFVGTASSGYSERIFRAHIEIEGHSSTGLVPSIGPNRMSYFLNLHGPSEPIETACSSSLVAIHRAVSAIENGECGMAIVGGVNTLISPEVHLSVSKAGLLSPDGRCKAFDASANGYVRSEGVGMLVLKKLSLAQRDGDHIYGVIRGSAENHGGRASSLTAPNPRAQADLLITAYRKAGIDPRTVGYIEAHGTGTALGDPIEINALKAAWSELAQRTGTRHSSSGESPLSTATCGIGTVKSNIGHLELAAGVAGVIKVLLQMQHKKLVKSLHCETLNPYIQLEGSPFYIVQENHEWEALRDHEGQALPRRAGVSSFGFGGANAHVILEEYVPGQQATSSGGGVPIDEASSPTGKPPPTPPALIVLSAKDKERLHKQVQQLLTWVQTGSGDKESLKHARDHSFARSLRDLAYTLQVGREAMEERLAMQVSSLAELSEKLHRFLQEPQEGGDWYRGQVKRNNEIGAFAADEDGQKAVAAWMSKGKYEKLLEFWVKGLVVDWKLLYTVGTGLASVPTAPALPRRISLPTYPFARQQCWIPAPAVNPHGLSTRPLPTSPDQMQTALLTPIWKEEALAPLSMEQESSLPTEWLVLLCDLPDTLASRIQIQLGEGCRCRSLTSSQTRRELRFQEAVVQLIQELQDLLRKRPAGPMQVQVVVARREEPSRLAALTAVLKVAQQESPKLAGQLIEVDEKVEETELLAWLHENQFQIAHQSHIRYQNGKRWTKDWQELVPVTASGSLHWKEGGCYLISGGAGSLARLFVEEIAQQVQTATVILLGRSALSREQQAQLERAGQKHIHIDYQQVDVSDGPAVHALIQRVLQQYGHLHGIIHAAGVIRDSLLLNKTPEEVRAVLSPKVIGVEHLDEASREIPLDFFILCSSLAAVAGGMGHADYAGANAYLDAFAHARQAQVAAGERQGATLAINWPLWEAGGMQLDTSKAQVMRELLGEELMGTETGIRTLYQALASGFAQVIVLHGQVERIKRLLLNKSSLPTKIYSVENTTDAGCQVRLDTLREALAHIVSRMLKVRLEEIDAETEFSEYGIDSITFVKFADHLNQTYQLDLTPALFYEHSTLERLTQFLHATYAPLLAPHFATASPEMLPQKDGSQDKVPPTAPVTRQRSHIARPLVPDPLVGAEPIAIIGMSGAFPQARDVESLWSNLLDGRDCIGEIPASRWDWQTFFGSPDACAKVISAKWAGVIEDVETFDPQFFGISPREAEQMDPQQRLLMIYVWKAIEDAGYAASSLSGTNTALFVGTTSSGYSERIFRAHMAIEGHSSTGLAPSIGPNRMSYFLNLHGPSELIDTACSSSLVAIHRAVNAIENGECGMAIVGGVNTLISPEVHLSASKAGLLSPNGRCKAFDASANGYVRSEGVGMLVLKKLSLAQRDGDHIYGMIRGSAENHGGRASSLTAPNPRAQADLLITAYHKAGIDPRTVGYIEAHGTGTALGDPIEINALKAAWSELTQQTGTRHSSSGESPLSTATCGIGTIKSNIGHLELAAGVAGVIKVLLQMQHKKLVKSLHCETLNPYIQLEGSPFYIVQENHEWEALRDHKGQALPRLAGVSSFGFGGANAHVILEEYVPGQQATSSSGGIPIDEANSPTGKPPPTPPALIVLSAKDKERLHEQVQQLLTWVQAGEGGEEPLGQARMLQNLAYTLQVGREAMEERLAMQVSSLAELSEKLRCFLQEPHEAGDWYRGQVKRNDPMRTFATDEDGQKAVAAWMSKGKYEKLLEWWVRGLTVDWRHLYGEHLPRRISLPTYPFARERYWISTVGIGSAQGTGRGQAPSVPTAPALTPDSISPSSTVTVHPRTAGESPFSIAQQILQPDEASNPRTQAATTDKTNGYRKASTIETSLNIEVVGTLRDADRGERTGASHSPYESPQPLSAYACPMAKVTLRPLADHSMLSGNGADRSQPSISLSLSDQSFSQSKSNDVAGIVQTDAVGTGLAPVRVPKAPNQTDTVGTGLAPVRVPSIPPDSTLQAPQLEAELARSLAKALYMEKSAIDVEKPFVEMGLDSVTGVEWIQSLNKQYASHLKASSVYDYPTIRQLAGFLQKELLKHRVGVQQAPVQSLSTLSLDDMLQQVQQGTLDIETADQVLHQLYLSIGLSPDSYIQAKKGER